jgi:hypothetical protein
VTFILDAGALVAVDRRDRRVGAMLEVARRTREPVRSSAAVIAQVWRAGARQANLAAVLRGVDAVALDEASGRRIGELLARSGTADIVDAHVTLIAGPNDVIVTGDTADIGHLIGCRDIAVSIAEV